VEDARSKEQLYVALKSIRNLHVEPYILSDDRTIHFDSRRRDKAPRRQDMDMDDYARMRNLLGNDNEITGPEQITQLLLRQSLSSTPTWIRNKIIQASSVGA